jgi:ABC-type transport system involved in multi-copper enzyme maturation permease subunit
MTTTVRRRTRRARLGRYFWWQLHDYMLHQAPATLAIIGLYGYLTMMPVLNGSLTNGRRYTAATLPLPIVRQVFADLLGSLMLLGTLFATNGIVANDRKMGYVRFYFAKPVSAPGFYSNRFVAHGAGLLLVSLLLAALFGMTVQPLFAVSFLPVIAAMYVAFGGVGFLLSTIWRFDWLSLVTVAVVSSVAWAMWGDEPGIRGWFVHLLPPMHRASELYAYVAGLTASFPWATQLWLTGYGAICFAIGLLILRTRSLA